MTGRHFMKRHKSIIAAVFLAVIITAGMALSAAGYVMNVEAFADELWSEDYYRVTDGTGDLTEYKRDDLDALCIDFLKAHECDLVLVAVNSTAYEDSSMEELAKAYYDTYGFGYGASRDCIMLICDMDKEEGKFFCFGDADGLIPDSYFEYLEDTLFKYKEKYGVYGVFYAAERNLDDHLTDEDDADTDNADKADLSAEDTSDTDVEEKETTEKATTEKEDTKDESSSESGGGSSENENKLPDWYPEDVDAFEFFHDDKAPRVVDDADILSDVEEKKIEERLGEIREETERDIVIFTDNSTYGFTREIYAADFYDFNGYGCGDDYEGACLMICMDPDDRGFYTSVAGPVSEGLYTEEYANEMDDVLYDYMADGEYAEGISEWIELMYTLYTKGDPLAPEWIPDTGEEYVRKNNADAPRIDDTAGFLSDSEVKKLTEEAKAVSDKYGIDIVIHTAKSFSGMTSEEYAEKYYYYNGYGFGEDFDGILLNLIKPDYHYGEVSIYASGSGNDRLTETNLKRLKVSCEDAMRLTADKDYYKGMSRFISQVDHMRETGRVPRTILYWSWIAVFSTICGVITGSVTLSKAKKKMEIPELKTNADHYLVPGSVSIKGNDRFLGASTHKVYDPEKDHYSGSSGSSSSSRRSSYSSHYSGSSGRSHTGSGRSF